MGSHCVDWKPKRSGTVRTLPMNIRMIVNNSVNNNHVAEDDSLHEDKGRKLLEIAKTEFQANITDTWPKETGLDVRQNQGALTARAKKVRCMQCSRIVEFRHSVKGLRLHCECGAVWPPGHITTPERKYHTLRQTLSALQ